LFAVTKDHAEVTAAAAHCPEEVSVLIRTVNSSRTCPTTPRHIKKPRAELSTRTISGAWDQIGICAPIW
jgi:hypothetical protein